MNFRSAAVILLAVIINAMTSQGCPTDCRCDKRRKTVYCNERSLTEIPYGIPADTVTLLLQGNMIENGPTLEPYLSQLEYLEKLDLHDNLITSFPTNLPSSLRYLSLTSNRIKYVGKTSLNNLDNLVELHLDSNNLTDKGLNLKTFSGANNLEELVLSSNLLQHVPEGLPSTLKSLRIDHNSITVVSGNVLQNLQHLIILDLSHNNVTNSRIQLNAFDQLTSLRTLDISHNNLNNIPAQLPGNVSDLLLSNNQIQYIYSTSQSHGDLQNFPKLTKLDLSSNQLRSVEKNAFSDLPTSLSVELHDNPWNCDCNLVYLKQWLTYTTSILTTSEGKIQCQTPQVFNGVTLSSMDVESLKCSHKSYEVSVTSVTSDGFSVTYDPAPGAEPPYVSFSLMFGAMLCDDCTLSDGDNSYNDLTTTATQWMENYTNVPILPGIATRVADLRPAARYMLCIVTSYQHPDQIGIKQCQDVMTSDHVTTTQAPTFIEDKISLPLWVFILIGGFVFVVFLATIGAVVYMRKTRVHTRRRYAAQTIPQRYLPPFIGAGDAANARSLTANFYERKGLPLVSANQEFDVTLVPRHDAPAHCDSCYGDSHDETVSTMTSHTSNRNNSDDRHPYAVIPGDERLSNDYDRLHDSGLLV